MQFGEMQYASLPQRTLGIHLSIFNKQIKGKLVFSGANHDRTARDQLIQIETGISSAKCQTHHGKKYWSLIIREVVEQTRLPGAHLSEERPCWKGTWNSCELIDSRVTVRCAESGGVDMKLEPCSEQIARISRYVAPRDWPMH
ncbi:hypothetical protein Bbelb_033880 [Branchiostoma belcheri]|nr:hypothetical protein Bbelb_033880 [Branchiostoma belcheri]